MTSYHFNSLRILTTEIKDAIELRMFRIAILKIPIEVVRILKLSALKSIRPLPQKQYWTTKAELGWAEKSDRVLTEYRSIKYFELRPRYLLSTHVYQFNKDENGY